MNPSEPAPAARAVRSGSVAVLVVLTALVPTQSAVAAVSSIGKQPAATLSASLGPASGGNIVTATASTNKFYAGKVAAQFQVAASSTDNCTTNYSADPSAESAGPVEIISAKKIALTAPALGDPSETSPFLLCIYNSTNTSAAAVPATLLARATYTAAGAPTILDASLVSMPVAGGVTVSVMGGNFSPGLTATLGESPLTDINVVDSTWFTATAPAHAAGYATLTISAIGGSVSRISSANNGWRYIDTLTISPNNLPAVGTSTPRLIDLQGYRLNSLTWSGAADGSSPDAAGSHVYLLPMLSASPVLGPAVPKYNASGFGAGLDKATPEVSECINPVVLSDSEITCSLDLSLSRPAGTSATANALSAATPVAPGVYAIAIVTDGASTAGTVTGQSGAGSVMVPYTTSTFVVAPF